MIISFKKAILTLKRIICTHQHGQAILQNFWGMLPLHMMVQKRFMFSRMSKTMNNVKIKNLEIEADNEPLQIFNLSATAVDLLKCPILL